MHPISSIITHISGTRIKDLNSQTTHLAPTSEKVVLRIPSVWIYVCLYLWSLPNFEFSMLWEYIGKFLWTELVLPQNFFDTCTPCFGTTWVSIQITLHMSANLALYLCLHSVCLAKCDSQSRSQAIHLGAYSPLPVIPTTSTQHHGSANISDWRHWCVGVKNCCWNAGVMTFQFDGSCLKLSVCVWMFWTTSPLANECPNMNKDPILLSFVPCQQTSNLTGRSRLKCDWQFSLPSSWFLAVFGHDQPKATGNRCCSRTSTTLQLFCANTEK